MENQLPDMKTSSVPDKIGPDFQDNQDNKSGSRVIHIFIFSLLFLILASVGIYFGFNYLSQNKKVVPTVDLESKQNIEEAVVTEDVLKIGVSAMISPKDTLNVYQELVNYIGQKLGKKTKLVQRKTYAEMNQLLKDKQVLAAFVCSGPYVDGHDDFGLELVAAPQMYDKIVYYSYLIVPSDSSITSLGGLRGKTFAFTDPKSNTGYLVPSYIINKTYQETPESFFSKIIFTGGHDNSINSVADHLVDAAAVDHLFLEYFKKRKPELIARVKVAEKFGPYCIPPFVTHPDTDPKLKKELQEILLGMDSDPVGKAVIEKIEIQKFVTVADTCYDSVREMSLWEKAKNKATPTQ